MRLIFGYDIFVVAWIAFMEEFIKYTEKRMHEMLLLVTLISLLVDYHYVRGTNWYFFLSHK